MKNIVVIYDDSMRPNQDIRCITGEKTFGDTIYKRVTLKERMGRSLCSISGVKRFTLCRSREELMSQADIMNGGAETAVILHIFSNFGLKNLNALKILIEKAGYINENYVAVCEGTPAAAIFLNGQEYQKFSQKAFAVNSEDAFRTMLDASGFEKIETDAFVDLSEIHHFRQFITGGFEARFFNMLAGDAYTVTKKSVNREKLKREYDYYYYLPEDMKMWYVRPFAYHEDETGASYTMERYHMTDIAIRYVHGAVKTEEFKDILDKLFYYLMHRTQKEVSTAIYQENAKALYLDKVDMRIADLKKTDSYEKLNALVKAGTEFDGIDAVIEWYHKIYHDITDKKTFRNVLVVGHGDLCFSNILYNQEASLLKLIDPRGASCEEDLYMNPYYDMAKLSHSICGAYDYFNSDLFEIRLEDDMHFRLSVMGEEERRRFRGIFADYLKANQIDGSLIRLYEASLFLSMLPLHIDREKKVFAFILNAIDILKEITD